jgi:chloramphenicol-sensitive protein RarD
MTDRLDRRGLTYAVAVYVLWGIVPVFWKQLAGIDPVEVLAHRVGWGLVTFALIVPLAGAGPALRVAMRDRRTLGVMALSGTLLAINWGVFVGSVATGHLLESSLGYFINPLVSVGLGMVVLGERMRRLQWIAIAFAIAGVVLMTWYAGQIPWISLVLAATFGSYGLVRKVARVDSLVGSTLETAMLAPIAAGYLALLALRGGGSLGHADATTHVLLIATGVITVGPLLLFTSAARRLPLSTVGFIQYLAPTGQFLLAVLVYDEPFSSQKLLAFGLIWAGLAVFSLDLLRARSALPRQPARDPSAD